MTNICILVHFIPFQFTTFKTANEKYAHLVLRVHAHQHFIGKIMSSLQMWALIFAASGSGYQKFHTFMCIQSRYAYFTQAAVVVFERWKIKDKILKAFVVWLEACFITMKGCYLLKIGIWS